jgi:hypothetical protein
VLALGFEPTTNRFIIPRPTTSPSLCFHYCLNVFVISIFVTYELNNGSHN